MREHVPLKTKQLYSPVCVKISTNPDDGPLGSKQFVINTSNKVVLKIYANF